jgi:pyruvate dehydrogenase E1 component alpha subunit
MHVADFKKGVIGANGVVGGGIPIATGAALSAKIQKNGRVCACFFGDGAMAEGAFHESLNIAALWKLPVVYVCENNQYGEWTHYNKQHSVEDLSRRGFGYGISSCRVDGMDSVAVYNAAVDGVERARNGEGPTLIECVTYRYFGHSIGGPKVPRPQSEVDEFKKRDPIQSLGAQLIQSGRIAQEEIEALDTNIRQEINDAVSFAEISPFPAPEEALEDLFV